MTVLPQSSRCPSSWGISGSNAKLKEQTYSRPAVPLPSPPLSGGSLGEFRAHLGPSGLQLSRSLPSWWRDACGQPRTVAICKEGQSQAQYSSLTARKLWAWALAPRPTFPGGLSGPFPLSQSPREARCTGQVTFSRSGARMPGNKSYPRVGNQCRPGSQASGEQSSPRESNYTGGGSTPP